VLEAIVGIEQQTAEDHRAGAKQNASVAQVQDRAPLTMVNWSETTNQPECWTLYRLKFLSISWPNVSESLVKSGYFSPDKSVEDLHIVVKI